MVLPVQIRFQAEEEIARQTFENQLEGSPLRYRTDEEF